VGGHDDLLFQSGQRSAKEFPVAEVQEGGRLIQHQYGGVHCEYGGERHQLAFTAGQFVDALVCEAQKPQPLQGGLGRPAPLRAVLDGAAQ
jgi:hypothetical protein